MNKKIDEIVDILIKELTANNWTRVDRLQKILEELVRIEIAAIKGKES